MSDNRLTENQRIFVNEYLIDFNATRSYRVAYPNCKKEETINSAASRLLRNVKVSDYLDKRIKARERRIEVSQDRVVEELAKIAFASVTDYVTVEEKIVGKHIGKHVVVKSTCDISRELLGAVASIKEGTNGIEVKLHDKVRALEDLAKHLGMFKNEVNITGNVNIANPYEELTIEQLMKIASDD